MDTNRRNEMTGYQVDVQRMTETDIITIDAYSGTDRHDVERYGLEAVRSNREANWALLYTYEEVKEDGVWQREYSDGHIAVCNGITWEDE